jgi:hypothetical protein
MSKIVKGHCPNCGPGILADVAAEFEDAWDDEEAGISGHGDYRILQCRGCTRIYFQTLSFSSEDDPSDGPTIVHWPPPEKRKQPRWLWSLIGEDTQLWNLLTQTYLAFNNDAPILAAIGLRTVFDRSSELLGVDQSKSFAKKLDELQKNGKIGADERDVLDALTDAGSAAAHRGWNPTEQQLETMFDIVESFIHRSFFIRHAAQELKTRVPRRSTRSKPIK